MIDGAEGERSLLVWLFWAWPAGPAGPDDAGCQRIANSGEREGWGLSGSDGTQMGQTGPKWTRWVPGSPPVRSCNANTFAHTTLDMSWEEHDHEVTINMKTSRII